MIPLIPGISKPMIFVTEHSRQRPAWNPSEKDTMGVIRYCGKDSFGSIDTPIQYHEKLHELEVASVNPVQSMQFGVCLHFPFSTLCVSYISNCLLDVRIFTLVKNWHSLHMGEINRKRNLY
jgi:hypothetical protein